MSYSILVLNPYILYHGCPATVNVIVKNDKFPLPNYIFCDLI